MDSKRTVPVDPTPPLLRRFENLPPMTLALQKGVLRLDNALVIRPSEFPRNDVMINLEGGGASNGASTPNKTTPIDRKLITRPLRVRLKCVCLPGLVGLWRGQGGGGVMNVATRPAKGKV